MQLTRQPPVLCCLCAELPFAGWLLMLRVELHMLAADRVGGNLRPAVSHYDSHLQVRQPQQERGFNVRLRHGVRARKRFPALGSYVRGIEPTTAKV